MVGLLEEFAVSSLQFLGVRRVVTHEMALKRNKTTQKKSFNICCRLVQSVETLEDQQCSPQETQVDSFKHVKEEVGGAREGGPGAWSSGRILKPGMPFPAF